MSKRSRESPLNSRTSTPPTSNSPESLGRLFDCSKYKDGKVYLILPPPTPNLEMNDQQKRGRKAEESVIKVVQSLLKKIITRTDLPIFVLHKAKLSGPECDVCICSRKMGVVIVEVKAAENTESEFLSARVMEAIDQLKVVRGAVAGMVKQLLKPAGIRLAIALPNLSRDNVSGALLGKLNELAKEKQVKLTMVSRNQPSDNTTSDQQPSEGFLDVKLLAGTEESDYMSWLKDLAADADTAIWETGTPDLAFKQIIHKFGLLPDKSTGKRQKTN